MPCYKHSREVPKLPRSGALDSGQEHPEIPERTTDMFLVYGGDKELVVNGYVDASFDTDPDDSKSQTGYVFILNGGAVSWCSSKQSVVAGSTCEAEYIAASEAANEGV